MVQLFTESAVIPDSTDMDENTLKLKLTACTFIVIVSFQIQSAGVQSQNNNKGFTVALLLELTVC